MTRVHLFVRDPELRSDYGGRRFCASCGLPQGNKVHQVPDRSGEDITGRLLGEHDVQEAGAA